MTPERLAEIRADLTLNEDAADSSAHAYACTVGLSLLDHLDTLTTERNTLLDRVDRLTAALAREQRERREEVDELAATIANERGEGEPPGEWWAFIDGEWRHRIGVVSRRPKDGWTCSVYLNGDDIRLFGDVVAIHGPATTARDGMRMCIAERARLDALAAVPTTTAPEVPR